MSEYPEDEKMEAIPQGERQAVADFLEWLESEGVTLGEYTPENAWGSQYFIRAVESNDSLMHRFWGVDKQRLAAEKESMLRQIRGQS